MGEVLPEFGSIFNKYVIGKAPCRDLSKQDVAIEAMTTDVFALAEGAHLHQSVQWRHVGRLHESRGLEQFGQLPYRRAELRIDHYHTVNAFGSNGPASETEIDRTRLYAAGACKVLYRKPVGYHAYGIRGLFHAFKIKST